MVQQMRAGTLPTLPTSASERADIKASCNGGNATAASASASSNPSPDLSNFVVPIAPSLTKKRARPQGRDGGVSSAGAGRRSRASSQPGAATATATATAAADFYVESKWEFAKSKKGAAALKKPPFFWELWMMMAAFGETRRRLESRRGVGQKHAYIHIHTHIFEVPQGPDTWECVCAFSPCYRLTSFHWSIG